MTSQRTSLLIPGTADAARSTSLSASRATRLGYAPPSNVNCACPTKILVNRYDPRAQANPLPLEHLVRPHLVLGAER